MKTTAITLLAFAALVLPSLSMFLVSASPGAESVQINTTEPAFTISQPISNGFVFVEGQYVEAPYVISRKDLAIYINDKFITTFAPLVKELPPAEKERPTRPLDVGPTRRPLP